MKPIRYSSLLAVRFADLDPYGHVNSSHYLDYVISARWAFARDHLSVTYRTMIEKKVGFYLANATMHFKRPIAGGGSIVASSHVEQIVDGRLIVPYEIRSENEAILHSDGVLEFVVIDLNTSRPISCPDWARELFFEEG
jgi:YbgC/YbaW family acyl-CoA thioester hydrolase